MDVYLQQFLPVPWVIFAQFSEGKQILFFFFLLWEMNDNHSLTLKIVILQLYLCK